MVKEMPIIHYSAPIKMIVGLWILAVAFSSSVPRTSAFSVPTISTTSGRTSIVRGTGQRRHPSVELYSYDAKGEYYGESSGSYMVKEFAEYEQLEETVLLAAQPLPERPDGIVAVARYTSSELDNCRSTEGEYERMARSNPATIFLRCFAEYDNAAMLLGKADVQVWPTFDIFYQGNRVARIEGANMGELQEVLEQYQFQNTQLDLFSEEAPERWGDGKVKDAKRTPRTTARFIPGYDWNKSGGFFDELGDKASQSFEDSFGNWVPNVDDE